jgi:hypothetical protein
MISRCQGKSGKKLALKSENSGSAPDSVSYCHLDFFTFEREKAMPFTELPESETR